MQDMQDIQEAQFEEVIESETTPDIDFSSMMTDELRQIMQDTSEIMEIMKTAKTQTKRDFYKKKIHKLQKKAKIILYSQYLKGRNIPLESSQISVE